MTEEQQKIKEALDSKFEDSDTVTAQHILYQDLCKEYGAILNKFQLYVLFAEGWGNCTGKAECGSLGYHKKVKPKED